MDNCIFCKIVKGEFPALVVDQNDKVIVFITPENHPLIIPKIHIRDIYTLDDATASAVMVEAVKIAKAVKIGLQCDGVSIIQSNEKAAGQEVFHFHLHVKPRWIGDKTIVTWDGTVQPEEIRQSTMESIKKALSIDNSSGS